MSDLWQQPARYAKERPARVIAGVLLVSLAVRKLARRA